MNAQTQRIRVTLAKHEPLATNRGEVLGQIVFCEGCCCGQTDKGFPPLPTHVRMELTRFDGHVTSYGYKECHVPGCHGTCPAAFRQQMVDLVRSVRLQASP